MPPDLRLNYHQVHLHHGDGSGGWPEKAPFDAIVITAAVPCALLSYLRGYLFPDIRSRELLIAYAAMAFATLDKGPIGFLLPGLIIVLFLLLRRELSFLWREGRLDWGIPLFLVIMLPWYLAVGVETHWAWDRAFIFKQNIGRFDDSMQRHRGPWVSYPTSTFLGMLPWSVFLPQVLRDIWLSRQHFFTQPAEDAMFSPYRRRRAIIR